MRYRVFALALLLIGTLAACTSATGCGNGKGNVANGVLEDDPSWRTNVPAALDQNDLAGSDVVHAGFHFASSLTTADREMIAAAGGTILVEIASEGRMAVEISAEKLLSFVSTYSGDRVKSVKVNILGAGGC